MGAANRLARELAIAVVRLSSHRFVALAWYNTVRLNAAWTSRWVKQPHRTMDLSAGLSCANERPSDRTPPFGGLEPAELGYRNSFSANNGCNKSRFNALLAEAEPRFGAPLIVLQRHWDMACRT